MMVSNYIGLCQCINDDFKHFIDPKHLTLVDAPIVDMFLPNQRNGEKWVYNTYYNFVFKYKSPYHGDLYLSEYWNGPNHFIENNFEKFIERYTNRINNFRNYLNNADFINFILWRYNHIPTELVDIIKNKYPNLKFKINAIVDFGYHTTNCLTTKTS